MKKNKLLPEERLIISIDANSKSEIISLCKRISGKVSTIKIGLELIYSTGPSIINTIRSFGYDVMLDAKLMDIPNTVSRAARAIGNLDVRALTIHTLGGRKMLVSAREAVEKQTELRAKLRPLFLGVTILTSLDDGDLDELGFKSNFLDSVLNLSKVAVESGMDGIICSPNEVEPIRNKLGGGFYIATPGIRLPGDSAGDQKRINTPRQAIASGADFIIVGRSITTRGNIPKVIDMYLEEIEGSI
ncbi:MAG: orotidine-5'-phosphate decarboxylase [Actinomycetota bacterium]|nr:orotidine-5'-phosphate decarboxylase [Actinomycetota bacterium]